jgi:GntR family transcriptional regulator
LSEFPLSTRPLHQQLREVLIKRIVDGEWRAGAAIPNEIELAREFGLSSGTVRKALDWMENAQLVVRQQGRGTFVRDQTSSDVLIRFSSFRNADGTAVRDLATSVELSEGRAADDESARLGLKPGARVHRITQIRTADGVAFAYEKLVLPVALFPNLDRKAPVNNIGETAFANGLLLGNGREQIAVGEATGKIATALGLKPGSTVLVLDRVVQTIDGKPAEWRQAWCLLGPRVYLANVG